MKKRDYKNFAQGSVFHIYNRGNNREKIFYDEEGYRAFLYRLGLALGFQHEELLKHKNTSVPYSRIRISGNKGLFKLHAFCLMPNHFHLLIEQTGDIPISKLISQVCTSYAMYVNKKYNRVGHVFQDKFKSVLIENNEQLLWLFEYIHTNPEKDKLVKNAKDYQWSSYPEFLGRRNIPIISTDLHVKDRP